MNDVLARLRLYAGEINAEPGQITDEVGAEDILPLAALLREAASAIEALAIANAANNDTLDRTLDDNAALRERIEALERERDEARALLIAFCGPHAATYAREFGFAPGELHPVHYDILERAGARMDDFRRADICLSRADAEANSNGEPSS